MTVETHCFELWRLMLQGLNARKTKPKYPEVYCSQCGGAFGPGDSGYSHCDQHQPRAVCLKVNYLTDGLAAVIKDNDGQEYRVTIKPKGKTP